MDLLVAVLPYRVWCDPDSCMYACSCRGNVETIDVLLNAGADVNTKNARCVTV
jgi:ankyrin repeat protein